MPKPAHIPFILPLALLAIAQFAPAADPEKFSTPEDVWRGVDPNGTPLDIKVLQTWEEKDTLMQKLFFTGEEVDGKKIRVFAIQGAPKDGKGLPGVLHIHGGGQTASLDWVKYWTSRGYVCVTFDFCGPWGERKEFTDWGPIEQANMKKTGTGYPRGPSPRSAAWFHWALAARRALTLLTQHPSVDPKRMGIFGISVGGTLCWVVAGADSRVKTAVPIYGCGYNVDQRRTPGQIAPDANLYKHTLSPEAHAPYISCPILFLNATNDFHGNMDNAYEILRTVTVPVRQAFTPRYNHHIAPEQGANLERWMAWQLKGGQPWPKSPQLRIDLAADGVPRATVRAENSGAITKVEVYYALGNKIPQARFWRRAPVSKRADHWEAMLPVMDVWEEEFAFANVTYASGICLSTNLRQVIPGQLGKARATLTWSALIDDCHEGAENWVFVGAHTDPVIGKKFFGDCESRTGGHAFQANLEIFGDRISFAIGSHNVGDPQFVGRQGMTLCFDCKGGFDDHGLTVNVVENDWKPQTKTYSLTSKKPDIGPEWRAVRIPLSSLTSKDGQHPASWKVIEKIELHGVTAKKDPPCFANFRWEK